MKLCRALEVHITLKNQTIIEKIRIGYVLKSADVWTLFSRRNSENSSHTHAHTPTHTPQIPTHALNLINHIKSYINRPNTV